MIKIFGPTNRDDAMSRSDYEQYYTQQQTSIARTIPGMRLYFANPAISSVAGGEPAWDSVAEMYWDSVEAASRDFASAQWNSARTDHLHGIAGRFMFSAEEREFGEGWGNLESRPEVKYLGFLNRKDGMSREEFLDYWFNKHLDLALQTPRMRRYRASVCGVSFNGDSSVGGGDGFDPAPFDGVVEMWFDAVEDFQASRDSQHWDDMRLDYYKGFAMGRMQVLVRENLVFDSR